MTDVHINTSTVRVRFALVRVDSAEVLLFTPRALRP